MGQEKRLSEWAGEVDTLCRHYLGCSWQDLSGDEPPLHRSWGAGDTPLEFVVWWTEKYDLTPLRAFAITHG